MAHDGQPEPRSPRAGTRRLRDISHLYLSNRPGAVPPAAMVRRCLRVAVLASGDARIDSELCANLAIQMTRLGRKTIVLDADTALPNPGFRLGLHPGAYLNGLVDAAGLRVERGVLGIGVVNGTAAWALAELDAVVRAADAVLVRLPLGDAPAELGRLAPALALPPPVTTMERAASQSPMFEAWMKTARRGDRPRPAAHVAPIRDVAAPVQTVDAAIRILAGGGSPALPVALLGSVPVQGLEWGSASATPRPAWARVPAYALHPQLALAALEPDHPAARVFEGLAQALLAGLGRGGPAHV